MKEHPPRAHIHTYTRERQTENTSLTRPSLQKNHHAADDTHDIPPPHHRGEGRRTHGKVSKHTERENTHFFFDTISYLFHLLLLLLPPSLLLLQPFPQNSVTTRLAAACETKQAAFSVTGVAAKRRVAPDRRSAPTRSDSECVWEYVCVCVCVTAHGENEQREENRAT